MFKIILVVLLLIAVIYFGDLLIRKKVWQKNQNKNINTILLVVIMIVLAVFIVFPKWLGYSNCFKSTYKGNVIETLKRMDFLYPYCRKELDSKGNYHFDKNY
jgi:glucan phosphoethanolaminetransferase (alkaline phosphatase superfamily)